MMTEYLPSRLTVGAVASLWGARTFISGVADEKGHVRPSPLEPSDD